MKQYFLLIILVFSGVLLQAQAYRVIVNSSNSTTSISKQNVSDLFLKKETKWLNGNKVLVVDQRRSSEVRELFTREIHNKSVSAVKSYWQQAVFSGKGIPPVEKKTDAEVIEFVKNNKGAIGYVSSKANTLGVKVLSID